MHACKIETLKTGYLKTVREVFFLHTDFVMWTHFIPFGAPLDFVYSKQIQWNHQFMFLQLTLRLTEYSVSIIAVLFIPSEDCPQLCPNPLVTSEVLNMGLVSLYRGLSLNWHKGNQVVGWLV
jgi:hypothetical protein